MNTPTLYQLRREYQEAAASMQDMDVPDEVIASTLEGMLAPLEEKALAVAYVIRNIEATVSAMDVAIADILARRASYASRVAWLLRYLQSAMEAVGLKKIESPYLRLLIRNNPPSVDVLCESAVPAEYWVRPPPPPPRLDKRSALDAMKAGRDVPGLAIKKSTRLEIK